MTPEWVRSAEQNALREAARLQALYHLPGGQFARDRVARTEQPAAQTMGPVAANTAEPMIELREPLVGPDLGFTLERDLSQMRGSLYVATGPNEATTTALPPMMSHDDLVSGRPEQRVRPQVHQAATPLVSPDRYQVYAPPLTHEQLLNAQIAQVIPSSTPGARLTVFLNDLPANAGPPTSGAAEYDGTIQGETPNLLNMVTSIQDGRVPPVPMTLADGLFCPHCALPNSWYGPPNHALGCKYQLECFYVNRDAEGRLSWLGPGVGSQVPKPPWVGPAPGVGFPAPPKIIPPPPPVKEVLFSAVSTKMVVESQIPTFSEIKTPPPAFQMRAPGPDVGAVNASRSDVPATYLDNQPVEVDGVRLPLNPPPEEWNHRQESESATVFPCTHMGTSGGMRFTLFDRLATDVNPTDEQIEAMAKDKFETFYGMQKGTATIQQVKESPEGLGWALWKPGDFGPATASRSVQAPSAAPPPPAPVFRPIPRSNESWSPGVGAENDYQVIPCPKAEAPFHGNIWTPFTGSSIQDVPPALIFGPKTTRGTPTVYGADPIAPPTRGPSSFLSQQAHPGSVGGGGPPPPANYAVQFVNTKVGSSMPAVNPDDVAISENDDEELRTYKNQKVQTTSNPYACGLFVNRETYDGWIRAIKSAKHRIRVLMYTFTDMTIALELIKKRREGVPVHVCLDQSAYDTEVKNSKGLYKLFNLLTENDIDVKLVSGFTLDKWTGILHDKVLIVDKTEAIIGSNNLSRRAKERNREMAYQVKYNYDALRKARLEFQEIYQSGEIKVDMAADHDPTDFEGLELEPEHDHDALSEVSAVREETDPGESASSVGIRRPRQDRPVAEVDDAQRSVNSDASTVRYRPALTANFKKIDCGDPSCDGGSCQVPASASDIILANRGDSKTAHGVVNVGRNRELVKFVIPGNVMYPDFVDELDTRLRDKDGIVSDLKTTTVSTIGAPHNKILTDIRSSKNAGTPGAALRKVQKWSVECLDEICGKMSNQAGAEFAKWCRVVGRYIWSQYIKLTKTEKLRFTQCDIKIPTVFKDIEPKMRELWKSFLPGDFGRRLVPLSTRANPERESIHLDSPHYVFLLYKEAFEGGLKEREQIEKDLGGYDKKMSSFPAKKTAINLSRYLENVLLLRRFGLKPYDIEHAEEHLKAMMGNIEHEYTPYETLRIALQDTYGVYEENAALT